MVAARKLSTADARRSTLLSAAIQAFAARGYYGTSTVEVAKAAGISQAYLFRLYPDKETLFAAVLDHVAERMRESLADGAAKSKGSDPESVLAAMRAGYAQLVGNRDLQRVLMHANCAATEPKIREAVRACYAKQIEYVRSVSGASPQQIRTFMATGLLDDVLATIGADEIDAPWAHTLTGN